MNKKVLITSYVHPKLISGLTDLGFSVDYQEAFDIRNLESVLPLLSGIIINSNIKMTAERIATATRLEFIGRLGSGLEIIDVEYAKLKGVAVINSPEGNRDAVAEHVVGMLLSLSNNLLRADHEVRNKIWNREANRGIELGGKTLGIIGLGHTGQALARKMSSWTLDIIYYDPYLLCTPTDLANLTQVNINQLTALSDFISFHVPLTPETQGMVDEKFLKSCKESAIIINTSRGQVIQTNALVSALETRRLGGACLDVFENEKPQAFSPEQDQLFARLYAMDNVVLTPHIAGWTHASLEKIAEVLISKISTII